MPPSADARVNLFAPDAHITGDPPVRATVHAHFRQLTVTAAADPAAGTPGRWQAVLIVEGVRTSDHRYVNPGALTWRELPLPLMFLPDTTWGHEGATIAGRIETIERDGTRIVASGTFDSGEAGQECERLVGEQTLRWVSADVEVAVSELVEISVGGGYVDPYDECCGDADIDWYEAVVSGAIMGATVCAMPAFPQAVIVPEGTPLPDAVDSVTDGMPVAVPSGTVALPGIAAAGAPVAPPASWFADPHLDGPTPLTVLDDGRVFGHAATWGTRHTGFPDRTVTPPRSNSQYAYFRTGTVQAMTADGPVQLPTGPITMATGHAATTGLSAFDAAAHYDNTGTAVADVASGEDEHGIWVAGALRPGVTDDQVRALRASSLSGDWRTIGGHLELVALLAVNVPGFPIPHAAASLALAASSGVLPDGILVASAGPARAGSQFGEQVSLVAAGMVNPDRHGEAIRLLRAEFAQLRKVVEPLMPLAIEQMARQLG